MDSASSFLAANLDHVRQHVDQVKHHVVPTLADLGQLVWDDLNIFVNEDDDTESDEEIKLTVFFFPLHSDLAKNVKLVIKKYFIN